MSDLFSGLFDTSLTDVIDLSDFLICIGVSLVVGIFLAAVYTVKTKYSTSFLVTLAIIPAVVCVVIMMVNGNIGAGVAVAGAFSLVRFRSAPGSAREICAIFIAMGAGLISGMGYIAYCVLYSVIMGVILVAFNTISARLKFSGGKHRTLRITIPEDLSYDTVFSDLFAKYTLESELVTVKTSNMGSLYKLIYDIKLKNDVREKDFIDELRQRNGNLEISITQQDAGVTEL